jgi:hypothetical protein
MARSYPESGRNGDAMVLMRKLVPSDIIYGSPTSVAGLAEPVRKRFVDDTEPLPPPARAEAVSRAVLHVLKGCAAAAAARASALGRKRLDKDARSTAAHAPPRDLECAPADVGRDVEQPNGDRGEDPTSSPSHQRSPQPSPRTLHARALHAVDTAAPTSPRAAAAAPLPCSQRPRPPVRPVAVTPPPLAFAKAPPPALGSPQASGIPQSSSSGSPRAQRPRSWSAELMGDLEPYPDDDIDEFGYGQFVLLDTPLF